MRRQEIVDRAWCVAGSRASVGGDIGRTGIDDAIDPAGSGIEIGEGSFDGLGTLAIMANARNGENCVIGGKAGNSRLYGG